MSQCKYCASIEGHFDEVCPIAIGTDQAMYDWKLGHKAGYVGISWCAVSLKKKANPVFKLGYGFGVSDKQNGK